MRDTDPDVRQVAVNLLPGFGKDLLPELQKALLWKEVDGQLAAAKVLYLLGVRDPAVETVLRDGFSRIDCGDKLQLVDLLISLSTDYRERVTSMIADCIWSSARDPMVFVDRLQQLQPVPQPVTARLIEKLQSQTIAKGLKLEILARATALGLPLPEVVSILRSFIAEEDNSLRVRAISGLIPLGPEAKAAVPDLLRLVADEDEEGQLRNTAVHALREIDPAVFDWQKYFVKELKSERYQRAVTTLGEMKPSYVIPVLGQAMDEAPPDHRSTILKLIGRLGETAASLKPAILKLLSDPDPLIRYEATLAFAKVDPSALELMAALRRQLNGPYERELTKERLSQAVIPGLEALIAQPATIAERTAAQDLLRNIRGSVAQ